MSCRMKENRRTVQFPPSILVPARPNNDEIDGVLKSGDVVSLELRFQNAQKGGQSRRDDETECV